MMTEQRQRRRIEKLREMGRLLFFFFFLFFFKSKLLCFQTGLELSLSIIRGTHTHTSGQVGKWNIYQFWWIIDGGYGLGRQWGWGDERREGGVKGNGASATSWSLKLSVHYSKHCSACRAFGSIASHFQLVLWQILFFGLSQKQNSCFWPTIAEWTYKVLRKELQRNVTQQKWDAQWSRKEEEY